MTTIDPSYPSRSSTIFRALKYFCGMLAVVIAAMVSGIALLVLLIWLRKEYPGILPQQILDDSLVDWSEKAVEVAIGLAGSVAVLAISLLTLQNQREVERERKEREDADNKERKEREDAIRKEQDDRRTNEKQAREKSEMLAHVRKYQSLCDAIENLFIEADYVASLVIAPVTKGDVAADGQRARRLEARLEVAQSAVWTSIEAVCSLEPEHYATVSDNNEQRLRVLPDLWAEYFEKKTPLSQVYLRETGFFGLERKDGGRVWKIHKIMAPLKVSRVDPNTQRRLRLFVTDSVVHNFKKKALEGERSLAEAGDLDRIQRRHDIKSSVDRLIGLFELEEVVHNRIEKFNEYITSSIASLLTSQGQLREDFEPGYIPDSVELCIERAENVSNEFVEKLKAYKIPEVSETAKGSGIRQAREALAKLGNLEDELRRYKVRDPQWLLDARHKPEDVEWLSTCRTAMAGMILTPESLSAEVRVQNDLLQINVGLLFLVDLCAVLSEHPATSEMRLRQGHLARIHLCKPTVVVDAAVRRVAGDGTALTLMMERNLDLGEGAKTYSFPMWNGNGASKVTILPRMSMSTVEVLEGMAKEKRSERFINPSPQADREVDEEKADREVDEEKADLEVDDDEAESEADDETAQREVDDEIPF